MNRQIAAAIMVVCTFTRNQASDLDLLQGKWTAAKTNQEGQAYSQVIEIEKNQLTFKIIGSDSKVRLFSKGTVQATKASPFDVLSITEIRAGSSEEQIQPVAGSRVMIYTVRDNNLFLASNFDTVRESEKPGVETYVRKIAERSTAANTDEKILGKWKVEVMISENTYDYELRITKAGNRLEAVVVSPRSGEHKCKNVRFENGEVLIEVDREIQGTQATFVYQGKLSDGRLSGKFHVKDQEDQFNGTWQASKG